MRKGLLGFTVVITALAISLDQLEQNLGDDGNNEMPEDISQWLQKGQFTSVYGHQVFYRLAGNLTSENVLVLLHGFPTSSYDYHRALDQLMTSLHVTFQAQNEKQ